MSKTIGVDPTLWDFAQQMAAETFGGPIPTAEQTDKLAEAWQRACEDWSDAVTAERLRPVTGKTQAS